MLESASSSAVDAGPNPIFHNFSSDRGKIYSIAQDSGYNMWFGSDGLFFRFDGYLEHAYDFRRNFQITDSKGNYQSGIYSDRNGGIWVIYDSLYRYDGNSDRMVEIPGFERRNITDFLDYDGTLLLASQDGVLGVGRDSFKAVSVPPGIAAAHVLKFFRRGEDLFAVTRDDAVLHMDYDRGVADTLFRFDLKGSRVSDFIVDESRFWLSTDGSGLYCFDRSGNGRNFRHSSSSNSICSNFVRSICFDSSHRLWIATGNGLSIMDADYRIVSVFERGWGREGLSHNSLLKIFHDADGGMWCGTSCRGVDFNYPEDSHFKCIRLGYNSLTGPLAEDVDGSVWIGTSRDGVYHYFPQSGRHVKYLFSRTDDELNDVKCIHIQKNGRYIYFGLARNRLVRLDRRSGGMFFDSPFDKSATLTSILPEDDTHLWIGTNSGIYLYDTEEKTVLQVEGIDKSNYIIGILGTEDGSRYVCSNSGVFRCRLDPGEGFKHPVASRITSMGENLPIPSDFLLDESGMLLCTVSGLVMLRDSGNLVLNRLSGLSSDNVRSVRKDNSGNLWISTGCGLNKYDSNTGVFSRFYADNGLPSDIFNIRSSLKAGDGSMYFGCGEDLVEFKPESLTFSKPSHPAKVAFVKIGNEQIHQDGRHPVKVRPGSSFSIVWTVPNYSSFGKDNFFYKLSPSREGWTEAGTQNSVTFSNLHYGNYRFELKSENSDGLPSGEVSVIDIKVMPFWYQTLLAKIIYFILAFALLLTAVRYIVDYFRRQSLESIKGNKLRLYSNHLLNPSESKFLGNAIDVVERNMSEVEFSAEQFARLMCMSRSNLHSKLTATTGGSATKLINSVRLEKSIEYLSNTDMPIEQIAEKVGFASASYFIRVFKKHFGITPGQLRKRRK